jgi:hypothetical protein
MKSGRIALALLGLIAVLYVAVLARAPVPLDWRPDYEGGSANPLGADVLHAVLPRLLARPGGPPARVVDVDAPPFLHLEQPRGDTTYLFLTGTFMPDEAEAGRLLAHARRGATVFVAAFDIGGPLVDSLGPPPGNAKRGAPTLLRTRRAPPDGGEADSVLHLTAPGLARPEGYRFPVFVVDRVLLGIDSARSEVLATVGASGDPVVVRVRHGRGAVVLATVPDAFSNAALLGAEGRPTDGPAFVAGVMAYLPGGPAFWDEHYKPRRGSGGGGELRYILRRPPLRMAYLLTLLGVLAYVLFRGRRWQRAIPVVAPPPNAAVEFVRTLGRLYHQHADHPALVRRKARFFLDRLRTRHGLAEPDLTEETQERLVRRGLPEDVVADVFSRLRLLGGSPYVTAEDVVALDRALDRFAAVAEGRAAAVGEGG